MYAKTSIKKAAFLLFTNQFQGVRKMENLIKDNKVSWFRWKLRIPLILFIFGVSAGIYQSFPTLFLFPTSSLLSSIQYIGGIALLIWLSETSGLNNKEIHFSVGILLIAIGFAVDLIFIGSEVM